MVPSLRRRVTTLVAAFAIAAATFVVFGTAPALASPAFRSRTVATGSGGGSLALGVPAGTVANDVMLTQITLDLGSATVSPPGGWTYLRHDGNGGIRQYVYYRVATASEPASYSWGISSGASSGATATYTGVNPASPIHQHSGQAVPGSGTITAPSLTTTVAGATLVGLFGHDDGLSINPPGSMTERWDVASSQTTTEGADEVVVTPGATGSRTATTAGGSNDNVGQLVALQPAGSASITGSVFEDIAGDALAGSQAAGDAGNPGISGVDVFLYLDDGDGVPDAGDGPAGTAVTAAGGAFSFAGLASARYWAVVDSRDLRASQELGEAVANIWGEQTYGPRGSLCADGSGGTASSGANGPCYGGRRGNQSDALGTWHTGAEHIALVDVSSGNVADANYGFSFNVVTTVRGGDTSDDDPANSGRTIQGSLRQFLQNSNVLTGANAMRFVPAEAMNDTSWWEVLVSLALPPVSDQQTTIDGTAFDLLDGVTVRDANPGYLGTNAAGGVTVGVDGVPLPQVERPELEIRGDQAAPLPPQLGIEILASRTALRDVAISGFGDTTTAGIDSDIRVGPSGTPLQGIVIERNVIGSAPGTFADPGLGVRSQGTGFRAEDATSGGGILDNVVADNLLGYMRSTALLVNTATSGWVITGNEVRSAGLNPGGGRPDGISVEGSGSTSHTIVGNLVSDASRLGIETWRSVGGHTITNNDIMNNALAVSDETAGLRLYGVGSVVEKNRITANNGPGIIVLGENTASPHVASVDNRISQNEFGGNSGIAIDLVASSTISANHSTGDGLTLTPGTAPGTGNNGLDAPVITSATTAAVSGTSCASCRVEVYRAVSGAGDGGYGEGVEYLGFDDADGSGNWTLSGVTGALSGQQVSAIAIDASGDTSEFGANTAVTSVAGIAGTVFEDLVGDALAVGGIGDVNNPASVGVTVRLYRDDGDSVPDAGDASLGSTVTDGSGGYSFAALDPAYDYWVVVDSSTVPASAGYNPTYGAADATPEQTYGPAGSWCADATAWGTSVQGIGANGPCYGGRRVVTAGGGGSDALATWHTGAEHLALVDISAGDVTDADYGLSFNVVVGRNNEVGGTAEQGSLDQFLQNANAIAGANVMRFVPAGPTNATDVGSNWWLIQPSAALTEINDADTTVDGTAYDFAGAIRDDNPVAVGTGGTVGVDAIALAQVPGSELQIDGAGLVIIDDGVAGLVPHRATVRALSITGAGAQAIRVNAISQVAPVADDVFLEYLIIGMPPTWQPQTLPTGTDAGVHFNAVNRATLRNSFIGWTNGRTLNVETSTDAVIRGNEFRDTSEDVLDIYEGSSGTLFENNRVSGGLNWALDITVSSNTTLRNNTIDSAGDGVGQTGGVRLFGPGSTIDRNVFSNNNGPAIVIAGTMTTTPRAAGEAVITQNIFSSNDGLAVDLQAASEDNNLSGDGITPNDGDASDITHGNREIDFPVITGAVVTGGTTTVTGTACVGCTVEVFKALGGAGDDDPPSSGTNYHGEGLLYLGSGVTNGVGAFTIAVTGLIAGDAVSATATDTTLGITSEFALNATATVPPGGVSGVVFEDVAGNVLDGTEVIGDVDNPVVQGVSVSVYQDSNTNNVPDAGDSLVAGPVATDAGGNYSFAGLSNGVTYWVVVDSTTVSPSAGVHVSYAATTPWSDQTFGPDDGLCADGSGGSAFRAGAGPCYGGRTGAAADNAGAITTAEHVARVVPTGVETGVDFGFSFNVVTNTQAAYAATLDASSYQGSLDQFVRNANAVNGGNAMRFVPSVPANAGGGLWWRIDYTGTAIGDQVEVIHDADTTIDGTAYSLADGVAVLNTNPGFLGANAGGAVTVGVDGVPLPQVAKPELELMRSDSGVGSGISFYHYTPTAQTPDNVTVRSMAIWGFAYGVSNSGIASDRPTGVTIEDNVIGAGPGAFSDPTVPGTLGGISMILTDSGFVRDNLIGFFDVNGLSFSQVAGWTITGNEVREAGQLNTVADGINHGGTSTGATISGNLVVDAGGMGIDGTQTGSLIENNTVTGSGLLGTQTAGIRTTAGPNTISRNVITGSAGPGVLVRDTEAGITITENRFGSNGGNAIDLVASGGNNDQGDGISVNNGTLLGDSSVANACGIVAADGNDGLDSPVITSAVVAGGSTTITGVACPGSTVQLYRAVAGTGDTLAATDYGEGVSDDLTAVGPAVVADGSGNFSFVTTALSADDYVSGISIDGTGNTSEFGANVLVNGAPVLAAIGDRTVDETNLLTFTASASDPNAGDGLLYSLVGAPTGAAIDGNTGVFTWTPTEAQGPGGYTFDVVVTDDGIPNLADSETITVTVDEIDTAPVLDPVGNKSVDELTLLNFTATATDPDVPGSLAYSLEDGGGAVPPGASITAGGVFSWTPTEAQGPGSYTFDVVVTDNTTLRDSETITVTVNEVNVAPVVTNPGDQTNAESDVVSLAVAGVDGDVPANTLTWTATGLPLGLTIDSGTGVISGVVLATAGAGSPYSVSVRATDNGTPVLFDEVTFTWTITNTNQPPVLDPVGDRSVDELVLLAFTATASDPDLPPDGLTFSLAGAVPAGAVITAGGDFTWTPTEAQGPGTYTFDVVVTDDGTPALADSETITVTVNEVNVAPVLDPVGDQSIDEQTLLTFTASATDADLPANGLTFTLADGTGSVPPGASITAGGDFTWTPTEAQGPGSYTFDVVVTDDGTPALADSETITVTVNEVNVAPVLAAVGDQSVDEQTLLTFTASATDADLPANGLTFTLADGTSGAVPAGAAIDLNSGVFSWTPTEAQGPGSYTFDVVVTDDGTPNLTDTETITITVNEVNVAPVLDPVGDQSIDEQTLLLFTATASDADLPANGLQFTLTGAVPAGAAIDLNTGVFTWTPTEAQGPGTYTFDVVVTDDGTPNLADSETITVTVGEVNLAPSVTNPGDQTNDEGDLMLLAIVASDPDLPANTLFFSATGLPPGLSINAVTGEITGTIGFSGAGTYTVDVTATDNGSPQLADTATFTWTVADLATPLSISKVSDRGGTVFPGDVITYTITVTNDDTVAHTNVTVDDPVPSGATYVASSSSVTAPVSTAQTIRDEFNAVSYANSDGSLPWLGPWQEVGESTNPSAGDWQVLQDGSFPAYSLRKSGFTGVAIQRAADLSGLSTSTLDFSYRRAGMNSVNRAQVQISTNGFAGPWTPLYDIVGMGGGGATDAAYVPVSIDVTPYRSANTAVRLIENGGNNLGSKHVWFDDVTFNGTVRSPSTDPGGTPPTIASGYSLLPGETLTATFQVTVDAPPSVTLVSNTATATSDQEASGVQASASDNVQNRAPVLDAVGNQSGDELTAITFTATGSDPDGDGISFSLSGEPAGASITAGGDFTWTPTEAQGPGTYTFDVVVTDDGTPALADSETITVTVNEVNVAPVLDPVGDQSIDEQTLLTFTASATDGDLPANGLQFTLAGAVPPGAAIDLNTGVFTWTPTEAQGPGSYTFDVVVTDDGTPVLADSETITVTVNEVATPPTLDPIANQTVDELTLVTFTATASDPDIPSSLLFSLSGAPSGAAVDANTGVFTWTPTEAQGPGSYTFDVIVTDNTTLTDTDSVTITVDEVNVNPVLAAVGDRAVAEGSTLTFTASATDADLPANTLTYFLAGGVPPGATINPTTGAFSYTPAEAHGPGTFNMTVGVTDGVGGVDSEAIVITVNETNVAPSVTDPGPQTDAEGDAVSLAIVATDPDLPANTLAFTATGLPPGLTIDLGSGLISGTVSATAGAGSPYSVTVRATDDGTPNLFDEVTFAWVITDTNRSPVLDPVGDKTIDELAPLAFTATASDPDLPADGLTFSLSGEPAGASITAGGDFTWTPTEAQGPGSFTFDVIVTDDGTPNLADSETITVTVGEVDTAPVLDPIGDRSVDELATLAFTATATDPDVPGSFSFSLTGEPIGASIDPNTGLFTWTPTETQGPGSYTFDVVVTDNTALVDSETITVTVAEVDTAPVLGTVGNQAVDELVLLTFTASASDPDVPDTLLFSLAGEPPGAAIDPNTGDFTWTPTEAQGPGAYTFDVVATDSTSLADSETITVTVAEVNVAPAATNPGDQTDAESDVVSLVVGASDVDLPANVLTFTATGLPPGLSIASGTGEISGTVSPTAAAGSPYSVTVRVTDNGAPALFDEVSFTWTITNTNQPPVLAAVGDRVVDEQTLLTFTASASDPDLPADGLTFTLADGTGSVPPGASITAGGVFTWTPTEAQGPGTYTFDVVVTDDGTPALADSETITVTVNEVNVAPVLAAVGDRSVDEQVLLTFTASASDADLPANGLTFTLADGTSGSVPAGAAIDPVSGVFTWTPTEAEGPLTYTFDVVVTDDGTPALADSETITVTVNEVNVAPMLAAVGDRSVDEQTLLTFTASATDADLPGNGLTFTLADGTSGAVPAGAAIDPNTGVFTWTPTEAQGPLSYTFDVVVTDDGTPNLTDTETITVTVNEVNVAPVVANPGDQGSAESDVVSLLVVGSDVDVPANTLVWSATGLPPGLSIDGATGEISGVVLATAGAGSPYSVAVRATDDGIPGLFDEVTFQWTISDTNRPPALDPIVDPSGDELTLITFDADASDPDLPPDTLVFSLSGAPTGASIDANTGVFTWTPTEAQGPGTYTFDVVVTDDGVPSMQDQQSITVTVNEVNVAPVLAAVGNQTVDEQTLLTFTASATDADLPANGLTFTLVDGTSGAVPAGAAIDLNTGVFTWTPTEAQGSGTYTFDVVVTDDGTPNLTDSETITVTVNEVNVAPVLAAVGNQTVDEQTLLTFTASATDADLPANGLTFTLVDGTSGAVPAGAAIDLNTGVFTWSPTEAQGPGTYTFDVVVTDDGTPNLTDSETITVTVNEVNVAPVLAAVGNQTVDEQTLLTFTASATDADVPANGLTFTLVDGTSGAVPAGAAIDLNTGVFTWTPTEAQGPGTYTFDVVVTDDGTPNLNDTETITVTVNEINVAPVVVNPGDRTDAEGGLVSLVVVATDSDLPVNTLTWAASGLPAGLTINVATGEIAGVVDPVAGAGSPYTVTVRATDDGAPVLFDEVTFTWTITDTNRPPVLDPISDAAGDEGTLIGFTATASDPDLPADTLTFSLTGAPAGAAIDPTTGAFTWVPTEAQGPGVYSFDVIVTDDGVPSAFDQQTVTITVNEANIAPILDPIAPIVGPELTPLGFVAVASDPDVPGSVTFSLEPGAGSVPSGASITTNGVFSWTPTEAQGPAGYLFDVVVTDNTGLTDRQPVTISVTEVATAPSLAPLPTVTVDEGSVASFTASATDADLPSTLTFSVVGAPAGGAIDAVTGAFSWTTGEADGPGTSSFDVVVTDDTGRTATRTMTIIVDEVNVAPVLGPLPARSDAEGVAVTVPLTATDADLPANLLTYSVSGLPEGMTFNQATKAITGTPSFTSAATSPHTVSVTVTDNGSPQLSDTSSFAWTITNTNRAPQAVAQTVSVDAGDVVMIALLGTDPDGDPLTFSLGAAPDQGTATITGSTVQITMNPDATGTDSFTFTVSDGSLTSAPATVQLVIAIDAAPLAVGDQYTVGFGESLTVRSPGVLANDADPEGKPLTAILVQGPAHGSLTLQSDGSFTYVHRGASRVTDRFTYVAFDGVRQSGIQTVSIDITGNQSPQAIDDDLTLPEDSSIRFSPVNNDTDPDGDVLVVESIGRPTNGSLEANGDGTYVYQPDENWNGTERLQYRITDGKGGTSSAIVTLVVTAVNDPPQAMDVDMVAQGGVPLAIDLSAWITDVDNDVLRVGLATPGHGSLVPNGDGTYRYEAGIAFNGVVTIRYSVSDGNGGFTTAVLSISVTGLDPSKTGLNELAPPDPESDRSGGSFAVVPFKLIVGELLETFEALRLPLIVLILAFGLSLLLGLSRIFVWGGGPVYLTPIDPGRSHVVLVAAADELPVRAEPGNHHEVVATLAPATRDVRTTGRRAQVRAELWIEVETDAGDGWVPAMYLTEAVTDGKFINDTEAPDLVARMVTICEAQGNLGLVTSERGLYLAHFAAPEHVPAEELPGLLADRSIWAWWSRAGSIPEIEGSFAEVIAAPFVEVAHRYQPRLDASAAVEVPAEFVNFRSISFADPDIPGKDAWRVFVDYQGDDVTVIALWREALPNPEGLTKNRGRRLLAAR